MVDKLLECGVDSCLSDVLVLVSQAHSTQYDKAGAPYVGHLMYVCTIAPIRSRQIDSTLTEEQLAIIRIIALAHDLFEDRPHWTESFESIIQKHIPQHYQTIIDSLQAITHHEGQTYREYIEAVKKDRFATLVKIADSQHNSIVERFDHCQVTNLIKRRCNKYRATSDALTEHYLATWG